MKRTLKIEAYDSLQIYFSGERLPLLDAWDANFECPEELHKHIVIGTGAFSQGVFWITEFEDKIYAVDPDHHEVVYLINNSLENFNFIAEKLTEWSQENSDPEACLVYLKTIAEDKGITEKELDGFWLNLIEATIDYSCDNILFDMI